MDPCLVLILEICFANASRISVDQSSIITIASIDAKDFTAKINANSDDVQTPDWSRMSTACASGVCVAYFKHCSEDEHRHQCTYHFSQPGDMQNKVLTISAAGRDQIEKSEQEMSVLARNGLRMTLIPVAKFIIESDSSDPPHCARQKPQAICWPKDVEVSKY